jgi:hypothetical protein
MKLSLRQYETKVIPPGGNDLIRNTQGHILYIVEATHPNFYLVLNDDAKVRGRLARGWRFPEGEEVSKIQVFNTHATAALTVLFEVGRADPLDEGLNVYTEQITPRVRFENPSSFNHVEVVLPAANAMALLLPLDCNRAEVRLFTIGAGTAYFGPDPHTETCPMAPGNQVGLTLDGATILRTCAPIYVRGTEGLIVCAQVFSHV